MNKEYVKALQNYAVSLLKEGNEKKPLWMLAKSNCSEVSRILGLKVMEGLGAASKPFILKGDVTATGLEKDNGHDILGYLDSEANKYVLLDPTIWQFFPKKRNIYLGAFNTLQELIDFAARYYKGKWELSEYLDENLAAEIKAGNYRKIIKLNCDQSPHWEE